MRRAELFNPPHRLGLVIVGWVGIPQNHLNPAVAEHGGKGYQIDSGHRGSGRPGMPEVIQPKTGNTS